MPPTPIVIPIAGQEVSAELFGSPVATEVNRLGGNASPFPKGVIASTLNLTGPGSASTAWIDLTTLTWPGIANRRYKVDGWATANMYPGNDIVNIRYVDAANVVYGSANNAVFGMTMGSDQWGTFVMGPILIDCGASNKTITLKVQQACSYGTGTFQVYRGAVMVSDYGLTVYTP